MYEKGNAKKGLELNIRDFECTKEKPHLISFCIYKFKWDIEAFFYQHKFF